jgi:hypothetical protein
MIPSRTLPENVSPNSGVGVPVPRYRPGNRNRRGCRRPAFATSPAEVALGDEGAQEGDQHLLAHAEGLPERGGRERGRGPTDEGQEALAQRIGRRAVLHDEAGRVVGHAQAQSPRGWTGGRAMLDPKLERAFGAQAVEVGLVSPKACRSLEPRSAWPSTPPAGALRV